MAAITFKGNPVNTSGNLPGIGRRAPDFRLVGSDLTEKSLADFAGKNIVLNIVPSLDTGVCAASARAFNKAANELDDTVILNVSMDLPFAQKRFCQAEDITNVTTLSTFRSPQFGKDYGMTMVDGPLAGLLGRAVVVINLQQEVVYTQLVPEIAQEPNYEAALSAVKQLA
jgi:thiol peroxidase